MPWSLPDESPQTELQQFVNAQTPLSVGHNLLLERLDRLTESIERLTERFSASPAEETLKTAIGVAFEIGQQTGEGLARNALRQDDPDEVYRRGTQHGAEDEWMKTRSFIDDGRTKGTHASALIARIYDGEHR